MQVIDALLALMGCHCVDGRSAAHAMIEERDPSAKLKKLTLSDLKPGMLVLMIDEGRTLYQASTSGQHVSIRRVQTVPRHRINTSLETVIRDA